MSYSSYLGLILPKNNGGDYGSPLVANSATDMTDHEKVYVYTGSEIGYVAGNWYYWNGITWTSGGVYNSQALSEEIENELTDLKSDLSEKASVIISSASGSIAHFEDGSDSDAVDVVAHIEPVQDLHGYDNPWPAGGGKNLFNPESTSNEWVSVGNEITTVLGAKSVRSNALAGDIFTISNANASSGINILLLSYLDSSGNILSRNIVNNGQKYLTVTAPADTSQVLASFYTWSAVSEAQLEKSSLTTYTPYSNICPISGFTGMNISASDEDMTDPTVYPITFPTEAGTVYGGYVDPVKGKLVVEYVKKVWTGSDGESWTYNADYMYTEISDMLAGSYYSDDMVICNLFKKQPNNAQFGIRVGANSNAVFFTKVPETLGIASVSDWKTWLSSNNVELTYKLATPITYDLTPTQIALLYGVNNIWNDTNGDTDVGYKANTKLYIDQKITAAIAAALNS